MAGTSNPQDTQIQQVRISGFKRIRNTLDVDLSRPLTYNREGKPYEPPERAKD
jgi:hypothetical protein